MHNKSDKQFAVKQDDWISKIENEDVWLVVFSFITGEQISRAVGHKEENIDNLKEYLMNRFKDIKEQSIEEAARLLIEHGVVK